MVDVLAVTATHRTRYTKLGLKYKNTWFIDIFNEGGGIKCLTVKTTKQLKLKSSIKR